MIIVSLIRMVHIPQYGVDVVLEGSFVLIRFLSSMDGDREDAQNCYGALNVRIFSFYTKTFETNC